MRKILGASTFDIALLVSKGFTRLVLLGLLFAAPVAYFAIDTWLGGFAYRIDIGPWPFLLGGLTVLLLAWLTVGYQSVKAAATNPVEAMRHA